MKVIFSATALERLPSLFFSTPATTGVTPGLSVHPIGPEETLGLVIGPSVLPANLRILVEMAKWCPKCTGVQGCKNIGANRNNDLTFLLR